MLAQALDGHKTVLFLVVAAIDLASMSTTISAIKLHSNDIMAI